MIDDNPNNTYDKISKNVEVNKIKTNYFSLKSENRLSKILLTNNEKVYLFITNYAFLIKYYSLIDKFYKKKNKIILTIHSGILNLNIKNYFAGLIFSVIYKKIDYLRFGSHSAKLWWMQKYPWMKISNNKIFYNGVKINKKSKIKKINTNNINVSFVGRLEQEHNPKFFISIANECLKLNNKIKFNFF